MFANSTHRGYLDIRMFFPGNVCPIPRCSPPPLPPQLFFGMITSAINALLCVILPSSPFLDDDLIMTEQGLICHVHLKTPNAKYAKLAEPFYSKLERTTDNYTTHSNDSTTPSRFRFRHSRHLFT